MSNTPKIPATIVITGASSGIGRQTALDFAAQGHQLVLASRDAGALAEVATACDAKGSKALVVPTDVTNAEAVEALALVAEKAYGRIDMWVNNAAVTLFSRFEDTPLDDFRRVIETNLFGYVYGARAVIPRFRAEHKGILVNVASIVGKAGAAFQTAYAISKFGIIGLSESLRQELVGEKGIHVCTVMPASIDTPIYQKAANYTGRAVKAMRPVYDASLVSSAIVGLLERPERDIVVGAAGKVIVTAHGLLPSLVERVAALQVETDMLRDEPAPHSQGNLYHPGPAEAQTVSGGWKNQGLAS